MNYLVRKPDAGKPHVRFDERGVETESTASYSGTSNRKGWSPLRLRLNFTAPLLDSTNPRMPRCCQFSEDRKEPSAGRSRGATDQLGDIARAENWHNPEGVSSLGHLSASILGHSPFRGCSFVPPPVSAPKISRVTCAGFSTVS